MIIVIIIAVAIWGLCKWRQQTRFRSIAFGYSLIQSSYGDQVIDLELNRRGEWRRSFDDVFCDPAPARLRGFFTVDLDKTLSIYSYDEVTALKHIIKRLKPYANRLVLTYQGQMEIIDL